MSTTTGKRTAKVKLTLTKRTVETLQPADKAWIAWDDRLIGFGVRVQPSGAKAFVVNYRTGSGGRKARNRRIAIGRCGHRWPPRQGAPPAPRSLLGRVARGVSTPRRSGPTAVGMPTPDREAFEEYLTANPNRKRKLPKRSTASQMRYLPRRLAGAASGHHHTAGRGRARSTAFPSGMVGRWPTTSSRCCARCTVRPCVDHQALRNPVELWLAGGGRYHRAVRRRISTPCRGPAPLVGGHRGRGHRSGDAGHLLVRVVHRDASGRDYGAVLGPGGPGAANPEGRGDEDR